MNCKLCNGKSDIIYEGPLKTGLLSGYTQKHYPVYQCKKCNVIWNEGYKDEKADFYESGEYRERIDGTSEIDAYRAKYDKDVLFKLQLTGTELFRGNVVCDIGCGGGSFLDFVSTPAKSILAIEPNEKYRAGLKKQGYFVYSYASMAKQDWMKKVNVITSFDVIEHVYDPKGFVTDIYDLLVEGGKCVVGTPTDYPVLREFLGDTFNQFIFQVQHPWVFSKESLIDLFKAVGFKYVNIEAKQKYGLGNLLSWLYDHTPRGDIKYPFISPAVDVVYKEEMSKNGHGEYLVVYAEK